MRNMSQGPNWQKVWEFQVFAENSRSQGPQEESRARPDEEEMWAAAGRSLGGLTTTLGESGDSSSLKETEMCSRRCSLSRILNLLWVGISLIAVVPSAGLGCRNHRRPPPLLSGAKARAEGEFGDAASRVTSKHEKPLRSVYACVCTHVLTSTDTTGLAFRCEQGHP